MSEYLLFAEGKADVGGGVEPLFFRAIACLL